MTWTGHLNGSLPVFGPSCNCTPDVFGSARPTRIALARFLAVTAGSCPEAMRRWDAEVDELATGVGMGMIHKKKFKNMLSGGASPAATPAAPATPAPAATPTAEVSRLAAYSTPLPAAGGSGSAAAGSAASAAASADDGGQGSWWFKKQAEERQHGQSALFARPWLSTRGFSDCL